MKMWKKINKLISTLLAVELIFSMCHVPIQANENSSDIVILDDGYEIGDGEVSDWVKFIDYDGLLFSILYDIKTPIFPSN